MGRHHGIDFLEFLVDLGRQVGVKNRLKTDVEIKEKVIEKRRARGWQKRRFKTLRTIPGAENWGAGRG